MRSILHPPPPLALANLKIQEPVQSREQLNELINLGESRAQGPVLAFQEILALENFKRPSPQWEATTVVEMQPNIVR